MKYEDIKKEVSDIANLENGSEALRRVRVLKGKMINPKIRKRLRGNYQYYYEVQIEYRSEVKHTREKIVGTLGRIEKQKYRENKKIIDVLQKEGNKQELTKWLEQY